ncbi:MAG: phosphonate ABC transporter substrate-binding protein [Desulfobacteraceae bacterium]|nr:MAG: phosphonate ABC transporter substrate-binding protein [Desulfobacteraceae bacterium]
MKKIGKWVLSLSLCLGFLFGLGPVRTQAGSWQAQYPELSFSVISSENEADRIVRYKRFNEYLERTFGVKVKMHVATEYAGTIEAMRSKKAELAVFGPASYAACWEVTNGNVEPFLAGTDKFGNLGYFSVIAVKADSPYKSVNDLKGKTFAFADPNSTSGYLVPSFYLRQQGFKPDTFFAKTGFSGSHENSILAVLNGTYDAAGTWWNDENYSNVLRMEEKGMIPKGQIRYIWKSPRLPGDPVWTLRKDLPDQMKADIKAALLALPKADPAAWKDLTGETSQALKEVSHRDYEDIIKIRKENLAQRKAN